MTGFGRSQGLVEGRQFSCEIKSVNSRNLDPKLRLPPSLAALEGRIAETVRSRLARGRVDLVIEESVVAGEAKPLSADTALAAHYLREFEDLANYLRLKVSPDDLFRLVVGQRDVIKQAKFEVTDRVADAVGKIVEAALAELDKARTVEGEHLALDIRERLKGLRAQLPAIREAKPETVRQLRERIEKRLKELEAEVKLDEQRLAQEIVYWTDRADITEEIVRFESHLAKFEEHLSGREPCGRKLDFLVQEIVRELNTMASKASNTSVAHRVVDMKSEVERVREQVQNLE